MPKRGEWKGPVQVPKGAIFEHPMVDPELTRPNGGKAPEPLTQPCRLTHPVLKIGNGTVRGGSAFHPPTGADVYVAHERGGERHDVYPWDEGPRPVDIVYYVGDGRAPGKPEVFKKLVKYLAQKLDEGAKVAIGCSAGHGRTGTTIAAVYKEVTGDPDAIKWVRANYCPKAVESKEQVDFLVKHFGINPEKGTKEYIPSAHPGSKVTFSPVLPDGKVGPIRVMPDPRDKVYRLWGHDVRLTNG
jgi:protein-tyrosine phosphatase